MLEFERSNEAELADPLSSVRVLGVGGAGSNVVDRIALEGLTEAELLTLNTDVRSLTTSVTSDRIQLGAELTHGLGAGGDPSIGEAAALAAEEDIRAAVKGRAMVFICAGLGGGTGSGAAPVVARIARDEGAFVVAFVNMPFKFEGRRRIEQAEIALDALRTQVHALVGFDNDRMGELVLPKMGIQEAFVEADKIISQSVRAVINLVATPGLIRIGMDDLLTSLSSTNARCLFGHGAATGDNRAQAALSIALKSPLLDKGQMLQGAKNVLAHIRGGSSMTLYEVELLMKEVSKYVHPDAHILFGACSDAKLGEELSVTLITSMEGHIVKDEVPAWSLFEKRESAAQSLAPAEPAVVAPAVTPTPTPVPAPLAAEPVAPPRAPDSGPAVKIATQGAPEDDEIQLDEDDATVPIKLARREVDGAGSGDEEEAVDPGLEATRHPDSPFAVEALLPDEDEIEDEAIQAGEGEDSIPSAEAESGNEEQDEAAEVDEEGASEEVQDAGEASQQDLPLDPAKGRFDESAPTIEDGEDLDIPTFLRKSK